MYVEPQNPNDWAINLIEEENETLNNSRIK